LGSAKPVAAVVGSNSLLGRELRDLLTRTPFRTKLIGADEVEAGTLTEERGEPLVITSLDEENLAAARAVFLAGSAESSARAMEIVSRLGPRPVVVDLTYALEERPTAHLRAPVVEPAGYVLPTESEHIVAHPAAILLALFLVRLGQAGAIRRVIAHVFEPASERGQRGIDELQRQTVNLLTFQKLPKGVYDEQAAFNLLARYGAEAPLSMESIETRIERHLATLLALNGGIRMPSIRLIQAPVFHGHSVSLWVEFEANPGVRALEQALASAHIDVRGADVEAPNAVGMAGQSGIAAGAIGADRNDARAAWFWVAADNLRIAAENAVAVALPLAGAAGAEAKQ
jgi:aspartate-semialdehyde dehydrogenase